MRTYSSLLLTLAAPLAATFFAGCAGRFNTLRSGPYTCTATVASNTCAEMLPATSTYASTLQGGGGEAVGIELPSHTARFNGDITGGDTMQFGYQGNPNSYFVTSGIQCTASHIMNPGRTVSVETDAQLVTIGTDELDARVTHRYPDFATCTETVTTSGPCEIVFNVHCAKTP